MMIGSEFNKRAEPILLCAKVRQSVNVIGRLLLCVDRYLILRITTVPVRLSPSRYVSHKESACQSLTFVFPPPRAEAFSPERWCSLPFFPFSSHSFYLFFHCVVKYAWIAPSISRPGYPFFLSFGYFDLCRYQPISLSMGISG